MKLQIPRCFGVTDPKLKNQRRNVTSIELEVLSTKEEKNNGNYKRRDNTFEEKLKALDIVIKESIDGVFSILK